MNPKVQVVILAAGRGKRMQSDLPKILHPLAGLPIIEHIIKTVGKITSLPPVVIFGHQGERLQEAMNQYPIAWVKQEKQLGTAHAVQQAIKYIHDDSDVLIIYGDTPLITVDTLEKLIATKTAQPLFSMITARVEHPHGYGRIIRDENYNLIKIVEEKDANEQERAINEINTGIYFIAANLLKKYLPEIKNDNAQQEFYLTDLIGFALQDQLHIATIAPNTFEETLGINDRSQLAKLERIYQKRYAKFLMAQGVTLADPKRFDVRGDVEVGKDTTIDINVILAGKVVIGKDCVIGANTVIRNSVIADNVVIKENCVIENAEIAAECIIGPFARIRPESKLGRKVHVGNFVEIKKTEVGQGSKINHLSYIGDSIVGQQVNIGAGTITCNYDGSKKHQTVIEDNVFVGSNTSLVAPVTLREGGVIAAGSTIVNDTPAFELTLSRVKQESFQTKKLREKSKG